jgi:putative Mg2+ transporter-C (MgtC) family protein
MWQHFFSSTYFQILAHLGSAWIAGSLIGLERSFRGRPAGFRTHALVALACASLMVLTEFQWQWLTGAIPLQAVRTDPTRMAQGIMTGIGFLGAGVIFKEGLTVRGLTTAASIWMTAALGILYGVGFYYPAVIVTAIVLGTLSVFRKIEAAMPSEIYAQLSVRFARDATPPEAELRERITRHAFTIANMSYRLTDSGANFEYRMVIKTRERESTEALAADLRAAKDLVEFRISPSGD